MENSIVHDKIILASASPRRRELLSGLGLRFEVCAPDTDESCGETSPAPLTEHLSRKKAEDVYCGNEKRLVIAADTVVYLPQTGILGKPKNESDAEMMLKSLSGKTHEVYTGVTVMDKSGAETFSSKTRVVFRELEEAEISEYILSGEPSDKAGAYAIQGRAGIFVERIEGDYYNVVGLPLTPLYKILKKKGVVFWA